jgi:hypothetical protein
MMDTHAALDRGTLPVISYDDLGPPPLELDDKDMSPTFVPSTSSPGFNEMSFFSMGHMSVTCHKKLLQMSGSTEDEWREKLRIVQEYDTTMHHKYCNIDSSASLIQRLANFSTLEITTSMHLLLRRPPYRQEKEVVPAWDDFDVLKVGATVLERSLLVNGPEFRIFEWKSWVKWHALAVVLAELLSRPPGPSTEKTFMVASKCYDVYARVIADSEGGMLWKPIAKLMRRLRKMRGHTPPTPDPEQPDFPPAVISLPKDGLDLPGNYNLNGLTIQEPLPSYQVPADLVWYDNGNAGTAFLDGGDLLMGNYHDPQLNWDMFLDEVNHNYSTDYSNMIF